VALAVVRALQLLCTISDKMAKRLSCNYKIGGILIENSIKKKKKIDLVQLQLLSYWVLESIMQAVEKILFRVFSSCLLQTTDKQAVLVAILKS
jgi:hypothetical protein